MSLHVRSALLVTLGAAVLPAVAQDAQLSEILVQARRDDLNATSKGSTTVLSARQLEQNNAIDMANIARYAPLVAVPAAASGGGNIWDGAGNTGINIRGVEGNRVSLEVDGISLPDAAARPDGSTNNAFGIGRDYFDPETFREVRIGSGASPAGGGTPGLGGSVSFITKAPEDYLDGKRKAYGEYKFGYTSDHRMRLHAVTGAADIGPGLQALIVAAHRTGEQALSTGSAPLNPDDWDSRAILAKLNWTIARGQKLGLTIDSYKNEHQRAFDNKTGASYPDGATQDSNTKRNRFSVEHQWTPAGIALFDTLDTRLYTQKAEVVDLTHADYISGAQPYVRDIHTGYYNDSKGLALDATRQLGGNLLSYGLSYEQQQTRRPWREDRLVVRTGAHQTTLKNRMADMDTDKYVAYVRDEIGFTLAGKPATLTPGLRAEQRKLTPKNLQNYIVAVPAAAKEIKAETDSFVTPSLNLSVELAPSFNAYAQYAKGTRLPSAAERTGTYDSFSYTGSGNGYAVLGNPNLHKETSNAFEVGLKGAPAAGVEFSAALFDTRYSNFIEYATQPADPVNYPTITFGLFRPENIGKANIYGVEFSARWELGPWLRAVQGYSVNLAAGASRGTSENTSSGRKADLPSVQPYKANATFAYDDPGLRGGAALTASSARGKRAAGDVLTGGTAGLFAVPGYTVLDFTAYWKISQHVTLSGGVYNVGDKKYWDYASSRSLPAGTSVATLADIERQARPGRNYAVNLKVIY
ncbi:hemoglobin/transferrin/lactoferrin receptor protein [Duganella sp. 1224]|uniref:TonB-dependent hemoglobin/transferrin/lactoferrin family receptor n=1 Tax=Duganella sp. 1224 TaxID=2587052 RepID=UPI0017C1D46F|nr:TonB-dependent hemoglobin/transferrin/lactoferrin family receptor [Duganella sp. 1224]NYE61253.1 hemoglobin/transferrin/lactoferrin receptor protein [Duganella sp. 1224]